MQLATAPRANPNDREQKCMTVPVAAEHRTDLNV
jgi:hypothetical protein